MAPPRSTVGENRRLLLLAQIDMVREIYKLTDTAFSKQAGMAPCFVRRMRDGRQPTEESYAAVQAYLGELASTRAQTADRPKHPPKPAVRPSADDPGLFDSGERLTRLSNRQGCDALLSAHLATGMHWITDPAVFAQRCAGLGL